MVLLFFNETITKTNKTQIYFIIKTIQTLFSPFKIRKKLVFGYSSFM